MGKFRMWYRKVNLQSRVYTYYTKDLQNRTRCETETTEAPEICSKVDPLHENGQVAKREQAQKDLASLFEKNPDEAFKLMKFRAESLSKCKACKGKGYTGWFRKSPCKKCNR